MEKIIIDTEFIKLDSFLKFASAVDTGGMAKNMIADGCVKVNGEIELKRGRKLRNKDVVEIEGQKYVVSDGK